MAVKDDFAERFTIIKESYGLTYADLSEILGLSSKSTVNEWVRSKRSFPKEGTLVLISNIFAVSTDWLLGRFPTPYIEEILTSLEENYAVALLDIALNAEKKTLPKIYGVVDLRRKNYTYGQRANIIFVAISSHYKTLHRISKIQDVTRYQELLNSYILSNEGIELLLNRELNTPLWDLESMIVAIKKREQALEKLPYKRQI